MRTKIFRKSLQAATIMLMLFLFLLLYRNQGISISLNGSKNSCICIVTPVNNNSLPWWDGGDCGCKDALNNTLLNGVPGGTCGIRAWSAGENQKVISYSLFGNKRKYYKGLGEVLRQAEQLYPDYYVRLYTEATNDIKEIICPSICQFPRFHVCNVKTLPAPFPDVTKRINDDPRMWRFLPIGDPQVDILLVRDSDSKIIPREVSAVEEWLASGVALHVMRDNPHHKAVILGGMWGVRADHGVKADQNSTVSPNTHVKLAVLRNQLFDISKGNFIKNDQYSLRDVIWKALKNSSMRHETYRCTEYPKYSRPFPTERQDMEYIGSRWYSRYDSKIRKRMRCPSECRPHNHQDWYYC